MLTSLGLKGVLAAIGKLYLLLAFAGVCFALWMGSTKTKKAIYALLVLALFAAPIAPGIYRAAQARAKFDTAYALFQERCKTAGEKIYRTVEGVEGVMLLKVRPGYGYGVGRETNLNKRYSDPNWPDAGLPNQDRGEDYIKNFLFWEQLQDGQEKRLPRGYLSNKPSDLPGYQYVDVLSEDQTIYRYRLAEPGNKDSHKLERSVLQGKPARYAVTYTNDLNESDRKHWVAGTTVLVVDTQTSETIAESTWYSFEPGFGNTSGGREPWLRAYTCPDFRDSSQYYATRLFVDQILKPKP